MVFHAVTCVVDIKTGPTVAMNTYVVDRGEYTRESCQLSAAARSPAAGTGQCLTSSYC